MTTDPVQEARDEVIAIAHDVHTTPQLREALDAYAAAIRREEAARVLPVLRAVEWGDDDGWCPICSGTSLFSGKGHTPDCALAAEITRLEALVGRLCPRCGGAGTTIEGSPVSAQWPEPCPECNGTGSAEALVKEGEDD